VNPVTTPAHGRPTDVNGSLETTSAAPGPVARRRRRALVAACAALGVVVLALVAGAVAQALLYGRVPYGVTAGGVSLAGDRPARARAALSHELAARDLSSVVVDTRQGPLRLTLAQLGISVDVAATARQAVARGRHDVLGLRLWTGGGGAVAPVVAFDAAAYQATLQKIAPAAARAPRDATLALVGDHVTVRPAATGLAIDAARLKAQVMAALASWRRFTGAAPLMVSQPAVDTAAAQSAAGQAATYLATPLHLRFRGHEIELSPASMATMLSVNSGADATTTPLTFDNPRGRAALLHLFAFVEKPAVNATAVVKGLKVQIKPSRAGFGLDMPRLLSDMDYIASQPGLREVVVPLTVLEPTMTTDQLTALGLDGLGSQFTTYFDPSNKPRTQNITQAAKLVDGTVIKAGSVFSLNDTLGPRTVNRGFDYAPVIDDGVLRLGVGGGLCQFATTLFNAAFLAGLPIVERHPHDFYIDHYPIGRDAQVAYGSQDLRFRNDTGHALLLRCWAANGQVTVVLVGSTGRTVTFTTSAFYDLKPSGTSRSHPRVITDDTLSSGITVFEQGFDGRTVRVVRTVRQGGKLLSSDTFVSSYAPKDWIKRIGTRG
jgi:vancomycin resistance protein YoaR